MQENCINRILLSQCLWWFPWAWGWAQFGVNITGKEMVINNVGGGYFFLKCTESLGACFWEEKLNRWSHQSFLRLTEKSVWKATLCFIVFLKIYFIVGCMSTCFLMLPEARESYRPSWPSLCVCWKLNPVVWKSVKHCLMMRISQVLRKRLHG